MGEFTHLCEVCHSQCDYICERCLRCENCCAQHDKVRGATDQQLGRWIWSRQGQKGVQLVALVTAGHGKGDFEGLTKIRQQGEP